MIKKLIFWVALFAFLAHANLWIFNQDNRSYLIKKEIFFPESEMGFFKNAAAMMAYNNYIFIVDNAYHRILEYELNNDQLKYIKSFGKHGQGPGDLELPTLLSVADDLLAIRDQFGISIFELNGKYINKFRLFSTSINILLFEHKIYILSINPTKSTYIEVYSLQGKLLSSFGDKIKDFSIDYASNKYMSPTTLEMIILDGILLADNKKLYYLNRRFGDFVTFDISGREIDHRNIVSFFGDEENAKYKENKRIFIDNKYNMTNNKGGIPNYYIFRKAEVIHNDIYFLSDQWSFQKMKLNPFVELHRLNKERLLRPDIYWSDIPEKERFLHFVYIQDSSVTYFVLLTKGLDGYKLYKLIPII